MEAAPQTPDHSTKAFHMPMAVFLEAGGVPSSCWHQRVPGICSLRPSPVAPSCWGWDTPLPMWVPAIVPTRVWVGLLLCVVWARCSACVLDPWQLRELLPEGLKTTHIPGNVSQAS